MRYTRGGKRERGGGPQYNGASDASYTPRETREGSSITLGGMKLYHYPGCSTCRRARKWLAERGLEVEAIDIVAAPPSEAELRRIRELAGVELRRLFNTSGQSYREGNFKQRLPGMDEPEALAALAADGKLIKRPLLVDGARALVGFDEAAWADALT